MKKIKINVPATAANLGSGFDVIGMALNLQNEFIVTLSDDQTESAEVTGEGSGFLPEDGENLVIKTFNSVLDYCGEEHKIIKIIQHNRIPVCRGLGSSASAVAAGILAAKMFSEKSVDDEILVEIAVRMEGHPDNVLSALKGGVVINYKMDERQGWQKISLPSPMNVILIIPEIKISTKSAREILPDNYSKYDVIQNLQNVSLLIHALSSGKYHLLKYAMEDKIHQPYRGPLINGFMEAKKRAYEMGAFGCCISGSGSTTVAFSDNNAEEIAVAMKDAFERKDVSVKTLITDISFNGAVVEEIG